MTHVMDATGREHEMTLAEDCRAIERAHEGWHVWTSDAGHPWATMVSGYGGVTLDAPGIGLMGYVIADYEHQRAFEAHFPSLMGGVA